MNDQQKQILLKIARDAVAAAVERRPPPQPRCDDPDLNAYRGCFVTLKNRGRLRGCIGQFTADKPLIDVVRDMAISSASQDPRFFTDPITAAELMKLSIEISVLSPLEKTEDPSRLIPGVHGVYISRGGRSGCFLPQVAEETGWTREEFLSQCCLHKAGLPANAWKDPATDVYLFTVEIIEGEFHQL